MDARIRWLLPAVIAGCVWIGANLLLIYGLGWGTDAAVLPEGVADSVQRQYESRAWPEAGAGGGAGQGLHYRVLLPSGTEGPQPLLVFLHGSGQRGSNNTSQLKGLPSQLVAREWRSRCPGMIIAPQCPAQSSWTMEIPRLLSLIESWRRDTRVDPRRVYVTGLSMGGFGTWQLLAERPEWFAAAVPICGGGDAGTAATLVRMPIWAVHGDADAVVPVEQSREMIRAVQDAGGEPRYTELPGVGHDSWTETYRDADGVLAWLYEQRNDRCEECR